MICVFSRSSVRCRQSIEETLSSPEVAKQLDRLKDTRAVSILVTGKTGTGKSTLINGLVGEEVAIVGDTLDAQTTEVKGFPVKIQDLTVRIYDTPGLQDGFKNEVDYMKDMEKTCKNVDLILYTIKMIETRLDESDLNAMHKFTCAFGAEFWDRVLFVLTFANMIQDPTAMQSSSSDQHLHEEFFEKKLNMWKKKLPEALKEMHSKPCLNGDVVKISPVTADRAPVLPAGHPLNPHLPAHKYWIRKTWESLFLQLDDEANTLTLKVNENRFKQPVKEARHSYAHEQPHKQADNDVALKKGFGAAAGAAIGGAIGGPVGAIVGSIFGALFPN